MKSFYRPPLLYVIIYFTGNKDIEQRRVKVINEKKLKELLKKVETGSISIEQAIHEMRFLPYEDLGFAKVDHHRYLHKGFPEVIYCPGKTREQILEIALRLAGSGGTVLATRAEPPVYNILLKEFPDAEYYQEARAIVIKGKYKLEPKGCVGVVCAGTADVPVAEEAALTAELMGCRVSRFYDVGVAGIHRLLHCWDQLNQARVLVVVAGMEGALASVVGGMAVCPVIAVPTSVGYGANFAGLAPLLTMLNSCAAGVSVVNIDNGFGAGYAAALINRLGEKEQ